VGPRQSPGRGCRGASEAPGFYQDLHTSEPVCASVFCSAYRSLSVFYGQVVCAGDGYRKHLLRTRHIIHYLDNIQFPYIDMQVNFCTFFIFTINGRSPSRQM
jgi:hypothetical protein